MADVSATLRAEVRSRARLQCEYCLALESVTLGVDFAYIDREAGDVRRLFHPRRDQWREHFEL